MIYSEEKSFACYRLYHLMPNVTEIEHLVKIELVSPLMRNVKISSMINTEELRLKVRVSYNEVIR